MSEIEFAKYQGLGNDFIIVWERRIGPELARALCDRHFGVGADGVIRADVIRPGRFLMELLNADGSPAEVSGNGLRCLAKYLFERDLCISTEFDIEAGGRAKKVSLTLDPAGKVASVTVDMGVATVDGEVTLHGAHFTLVSIGNPHAVTFVDDLEAAPVEELGPLVERDPRFPNRTNVEFVHLDGNVVEVAFWERGVGVTLASGSGSCASVVAAGLSRADVRTRGGDLVVERTDDGSVLMTGPAAYVFDGRFVDTT